MKLLTCLGAIVLASSLTASGCHKFFTKTNQEHAVEEQTIEYILSVKSPECNHPTISDYQNQGLSWEGARKKYDEEHLPCEEVEKINCDLAEEVVKNFPGMKLKKRMYYNSGLVVTSTEKDFERIFQVQAERFEYKDHPGIYDWNLVGNPTIPQELSEVIDLVEPNSHAFIDYRN